MERIVRVGAITLLGIGLCVGCSKERAAPPNATSSTNTPASATPTIDTQPIAAIATSFMDAVIKGDSQRASALLTPQAIERIIATKIQFNPSGLESATFRLGEIRTPTQDQAIAQFELIDSSAAANAASEEGCCLLRNVQNEWRVSGIAYGRGPDQPWMMSDFETGKTIAIPREPSRNAGVQQASATSTGRPSPPRTAEQSEPATVR